MGCSIVILAFEPTKRLSRNGLTVRFSRSKDGPKRLGKTKGGGELHPRVSINTLSSFNWPLAQDLALLATLGVRHFGFPMLKIEADIPAGIGAIRASGLDVACVAASASNSSLLDPDA